MHNHAIANDIGGTGVQHTAGHQVQRILCAFVIIDGVPSIGTALCIYHMYAQVCIGQMISITMDCSSAT